MKASSGKQKKVISISGRKSIRGLRLVRQRKKTFTFK